MRRGHIRASHIRVFRMWWCRIWRGHIRLVRIRRGRLRGLGLFVDDVLGVRNTPVGPAKLAADDVARLFQLLDGTADSVHTLLADGGKPPCAVIPVLREREEHGQQPLGFQRQGCIFQMIIWHDGVISRPFYTIDSHFNSLPVKILCYAVVDPSSRAKRASSRSTLQFCLNCPRGPGPNMARARLSISSSRAHNSGWWWRSFFSSPMRWRGQHQQDARRYISYSPPQS